MPYKASAPGSLMLLGEYAVLYGKQALVCAVDKRVNVLLSPRLDQRIEIRSALGTYVTDVSDLRIERPFHFVLGAIKQCQSRLKTGFDLDIVSEFSDMIGLGSSAAVTTATLAALLTWLSVKITPLDLVRHGRQVIRAMQGAGSGADVAASVYGGMVGYQAQPLLAERFAVTHPLTAIYAGFKTPTVDAIKQVQKAFSTRPQLLRGITNNIGLCAQEGIQYVRKADWVKLGEIMSVQQGFMESLGVSMPILRNIMEGLRSQPDVLGVKISGAGLGDCVVALGQAKHVDPTWQAIPIQMTLQGVYCEKI